MGNIKMMAEEKIPETVAVIFLSTVGIIYSESSAKFLIFFGRFVFIGDRKAERAGGRYTAWGFRSESPAQPTN